MTRIERDSLGEKNIPAGALYGIQTARAMENFPISGLRAHPVLVDATVHVKRAAALANRELGRLEAEVADAIVSAAEAVLAGSHRDQFVIDVYQAGAGTSHNMNVNEVLANLAADRLGVPRGDYRRVHPNDHVNMGQSTNDVFPTATRLRPAPDIRRTGRVRRRTGRRARREVQGLCHGDQDRPYASAGCRADHARAGVRGLCRLRAPRRATTCTAPPGRCTN